MVLVDNDRWAGQFPLEKNARYEFTIEGWRDGFSSWMRDTLKKRDAGVDIRLETIEGVTLVKTAADLAEGRDKDRLTALVAALAAEETGSAAQLDRILMPESRRPHPPQRRAGERLALSGDRAGDRRSPRGAVLGLVRDLPALAIDGREPSRHLRRRDPPPARDPRTRLRRAVLHPDPSGRAHQPQGQEQHPEGAARRCRLGLRGRRPRRAATRRSIPNSARWRISSASSRRATPTAWRSRSTSRSNARPTTPGSRTIPNGSSGGPDGTLKFAENPPKKYEDISNVHFYGGALPSLWIELRDILLGWCSARRAHLPGRQPAHQADPVLGVGDRRGERALSPTRSSSPRPSRGRR